MKKRVLVGLSGGVDSTLTAILLQRDGYEVEGVYMKLHEKEGYHEVNFAKAERVGAYLAIKVHFLDLSSEFKDSVYDYFVDGYRDGLTPNPCVICNRTIKFGKMVEFADRLGIEYLSTGHYARSDGEDIYMAKDKSKDQSYFLSNIKKEVIPRLIFPLGEWMKEDVKNFVQEIEILEDLATQKESSEICFVENEYTEILEKHMDIDMKGDTLDTEGNVIGDHKGYMHYTIGKRRGFFVNGAHDPHYVLSINPKENQIVVGTKEKLKETDFKVKNLNLFHPTDRLVCSVKVRYRTHGVDAEVSIEDDIATVHLKEPVFGLARGQVAVFYDGEKLLGGGIII